MTLQKTGLSIQPQNTFTADTVGEAGPGRPTWRRQRMELGRVARTVARGEVRTGLHHAQSLAANVWNFQARGGRVIGGALQVDQLHDAAVALTERGDGTRDRKSVL